MFISISLKQQSRETLQAFEERITLRDEVMECYLMTGDADRPGTDFTHRAGGEDSIQLCAQAGSV